MPDIFTPVSENPIKAPGSPVGLFSTYVENPTNFTFNGMEEGEYVRLFLRSHLATLFSPLLIFLVLLFLPIIFSIVGAIIGITIPFFTGSMAFFISIFYVGLLVSFLFIRFLHWFYNIFLVTNKRIIDIDYSDIVLHNISTTRITNIEDVSYTQAGFLGGFLNMGHLHILTASDKKNFEAFSVPKPKQAADIVNSLTGKGKHA
jgi:membrane protein YdbS with pleckstrin-like domain